MENKLSELQARLKVFGMIFRIGSDLFRAPDFETAAGMAVNNPVSLLKFKRATLLEKADGRIRVVAQYGQVAVNPHAEVALRQVALLSKADFPEDKPLRLTRTPEEGTEYLPEVQDALNALLEEGGELIAFQLPAPAFLGDPGFSLIWLLEYDSAIPAYALTSANLLVHNLGEGLFCQRCCSAVGQRRFRKRLSAGKWAAIIIAVLAAILLLVRVRDSVNAEFTLKSPETVSAYAWFDGPIAECHKSDGATVRKGEVILRYDTSALAFRLANARSQVAEIAKEYDLESAAAFNDRSKLGRVQLIQARLEGARVAVKEAQWYMDHAEITAPADGVLVLAEGRAELLVNKAVRTGDKLFDVYSGKGVIAEIMVNERESSILLGKLSATLFLYTQPDRTFEAKILEVKPYAELNEQRTYCYKVRAELSADMPLRYGMRGVAKLRGDSVSLGYFLFRNLVIYLRWL